MQLVRVCIAAGEPVYFASFVSQVVGFIPIQAARLDRTQLTAPPPKDVNRSTRTQALFESIQTINRNHALSRIVLCGFFTRLALVQLVESPNLYISSTLTTMLN